MREFDSACALLFSDPLWRKAHTWQRNSNGDGEFSNSDPIWSKAVIQISPVAASDINCSLHEVNVADRDSRLPSDAK